MDNKDNFQQDLELEVSANDLMSITDDGITDVDESQSSVITDTLDTEGQENSAEENSVEDNAVEGQKDAVETPGQEEATQQNFEDLSAAALQVKLLEEQGLKIYNELDKDLDFETFAKDIPVFIDQVVEARYEEKVQELGRQAEYAKMLMEDRIPQEVLQPAMRAEAIANFDIQGDNVTEDELVDVVFKTELRKGRDKDEAQLVADAAKSRGLDFLKAKAEKDIAWTNEYIDNIKTQAKNQYQQRIQAQQMQEKAAHDEFVKNLQEKIEDPKIQQQVYDFQYKRNIPVTIDNPDGSKKQVYVTPYEIAVHEVQQDPSKQIALMQFLMSGLDARAIVGNTIKNEVSNEILNALKKRTTATLRQTRKKNSLQTEQNQELDSVETIDEIEI